MLLRSPRNLHYPITVTELLVRTGESVEKAAPLFAYFYKSTVTEGNKYGEEFQVEKTFPTRFESETDGVLLGWKVQQGSVITEPDVDLVEIEEPCRHDVQFGGICANCLKDMTQTDYTTSKPDTTRANITTTHKNTALRVSREEAARSDQDTKRRLLKSKKLILVVDLDQTIIHATVDPTVAEWQGDTNNPNHEAVKDVRSFQLVDDGPGRGCWYYIKLRPGLVEFLENVSKIYELHIYTMGTGAYAMNIAKIVDPEKKIFGDRILSRDESGSMTAKNLQRLFPVDTSMVVIIDDRGDVWSWCDNLIKVKPYDFFVGIGDINGSFLPRRQELLPSSASPVTHLPVPERTKSQSEDGTPEGSTAGDGPSTSTAHTNGTSTEQSPAPALATSTLEQLVAMSGSNDTASLKQKATQQDETIAAQITDRPLLQRQQILDEADDKVEAATTELKGDNSDGTNPVSHRPRHNLLQDDDAELLHLGKALRNVHRKFYEGFDKSSAGVKGGRIAELREVKSPKKRPEEDVQVVPDVEEIMPSMKRKILKNVVLTFSGVVPLGTYVRNSDIGRWAASFGASIETEVHRNTTHVIAARNRRTQKVRTAARNPKIKIVTMAWLYQCISQWKLVDETPYLIEVEPDREHVSAASSNSPFDELVDGTLSSSEDDANTAEADGEGQMTLSLNTGVANGHDEEEPISPEDQIADDDWKAMLDEIEAASDTEDGSELDGGTDSESDASQDSRRSSKKRKRDTVSGESTDTESGEGKVNGKGGSSKLQLRKKRALERTSSLTHVATLRSVTYTPSSSVLVPGEGVVEKEDTDEVAPSKGVEVVVEKEAVVDDDDDDGFDAMFQAELEAQLDAGGGGEAQG